MVGFILPCVIYPLNCGWFFVDIASVANSKTSVRSLSPGGSVHTLNDALSYASGSLGAGTIGEGSSIPLSPQQVRLNKFNWIKFRNSVLGGGGGSFS